ncbi:MAG TPA: cytochrome P450 [Candidatus Limnocylindrales bacterium]|nr:cytochrome P450 [Candidatus Limnocylindrales bacterium]
MGALLTTFTTTIVLDRYEDIREALFHPELSRTFDRRTYDEGNIRDGVVSTSHGPVHRMRRRIENSQFRPDVLRLYERDLFPRVLNDLLDRVVDGPSVDLFAVAEVLSVVLAALRAGIDVDEQDLAQLRELVRYVDVFSQGSAILDARDPEAVRRLVVETYATFERDWLRPSWERRAALIERDRRDSLGDEVLPHDILSVLLQHRDDARLELADAGRVVREVATYLQGGTHTSAQTMANAFDLLFEADAGPDQPALVARCADDLGFCQRVVHETLRLRPTTPRIRRRVETDTVVAGRVAPRDSLIVLDAAAGNRDRELFGDDADRFDPDRVIDSGAPRWGLSFGAGAHQCPGRSVAGGFPVPAHADLDPEHIFGLVALEIREVARRGIHPDPERAPRRDTRTERFTRWASYPVRFDRWAAPT